MEVFMEVNTSKYYLDYGSTVFMICSVELQCR